MIKKRNMTKGKNRSTSNLVIGTLSADTTIEQLENVLTFLQTDDTQVERSRRCEDLYNWAYISYNPSGKLYIQLQWKRLKGRECGYIRRLFTGVAGYGHTGRKFKVMLEEGLQVYANGNAKALPEAIPTSAEFIKCLDGIVGLEGMVSKIHHRPWKIQGMKSGYDYALYR